MFSTLKLRIEAEYVHYFVAAVPEIKNKYHFFFVAAVPEGKTYFFFSNMLRDILCQLNILLMCVLVYHIPKLHTCTMER